MDDLRGFRVAVTANRLVREQSLLFERLGAAVVVVPLVQLALEPEEGTRRVIERVLQSPPRIAVFSTGLGVRWLFSIADAGGVGDTLRATLDNAYVVARGPKARGALAAAGLHVDWVAPSATGAEVAEHVRALSGFEHELFALLDGVTASPGCPIAAIGGSQARTYTCLPCAGGPEPLATLAGIHAITFTSPVAVAGLRVIAGDQLDLVLARLAEITVVGVGQVTAAALRTIGVKHVLVPAEHRLGEMVRLTSSALAAQTVQLAPGIELRGNTIACGTTLTALTAGERRLLKALLDAAGAVVGKRSLGRLVGVDSDDPHAVEAIVTRLRRRLGPAARLIETVPRRGYRLMGPDRVVQD